jgi:hypothetical protein
VTDATDPAGLIAQRAAAQAERARVGEGRWQRFQEANRKRYAVSRKASRG